MKRVNTNTEDELWSEVTRWTIAIAAVFTATLILGYIALFRSINPNVDMGSTWKSLILALSLETLPLPLLFLVSSIALRRYNQLRRDHDLKTITNHIRQEMEGLLERHISHNTSSPLTLFDVYDDVDWGHKIEDAHEIDIAVHYLDSWIRRQSPSLESMLRNGGRIRIAIPNSKNDILINAIACRLPKLSVEDVRTKVEKTHDKMMEVLNACGNKSASIETYFIDKQIWYSSICVDGNLLMISPYEQERRMRIESPVIQINLSAYPTVKQWFVQEFNGMMAGAITVKKSS